MVSFSSSKGKSFIGVDLGSGSVKMAQLRTSAEAMEILALAQAQIDLPPSADQHIRLEAQAQQVRRLLKEAGFKGRQAVVSLPTESVFLQPIRLPHVAGEQLPSLLEQELQGKLPWNAEPTVMRHILAGTVYAEAGEMQEMLVVAVARKALDEYLSALAKAGLDIVAVNIEACALVECFARFFRRASDEGRMTLFIDIGSSSTKVVLAQGPKMVFAHNLALGGNAMDAELAKALKIPLAQAHAVRRKMVGSQVHTQAEDELFRLLDVKIAQITDDITHCLLYCESAFRNQAVERVIFVGGQAHNKRLCQSIAQRLNLPAQVGDPLAGVQRSSQAQETLGETGPCPAWAVAVGLSLGATLL